MPRDEPLQATAPLDSPAAFTSFDRFTDSSTDFFSFPHPHHQAKDHPPSHHLRNKTLLSAFATSDAALSPSLAPLPADTPKKDITNTQAELPVITTPLATPTLPAPVPVHKLDHQPTAQPPTVSYHSARRPSMDPSRFPGPQTDSIDVIASAAEEPQEVDTVVDEMGVGGEGMDVDQSGNVLTDVGQRSGEGDGLEPRVRVVGKDGTELGSPLGRSPFDAPQAVDTIEASEPDDEEVYKLGVGERDVKLVKGSSGGGLAEEGETPHKAAITEEDEDDWEVGLRRQEHSSEFQDEAGLDYGDEAEGFADDDEGMDPMENM